MNVFDSVKQSITTKQAALHYGFKPNRSNLICCPFHRDRTPSMKVDERYFCFGCGATGDVIDFVSGIFRLNCTEAAIKIAEDFGILYEYQRSMNETNRTKKKIFQQPVIYEEDKFKKRVTKAIGVCSDYRRMLIEFQKRFSPKAMDEEWDERFVYAGMKIPYLEYYLDILLFGNLEEQKELLNDKEEEWEIIGQFVTKYRSGNGIGQDEAYDSTGGSERITRSAG